MTPRIAMVAGLVAAMAFTPRSLTAQDPTPTGAGDSVIIRFVDADLKAVIQALGRYLDRPLLVGAFRGQQVTFESPAPVPREEVRDLLRGLAEAHGLELVADSAFYRVGPRQETRDQRPAASGEQASEREPPQLFVLRLRHARATDVAGTIGALFGVAAGYSGRSLSSGTLSDELRRNTEATTARASPAAGSEREALGATLSGDVTIVPDELTNSLLIRATREDYDLIVQAVQQLDLRPLQVLIQVLIVEARKDRLFSIGVDAELDNVEIGDDVTLAGSLIGGGLGNLVLRVMKLGSFDLDAMVRTAVARGDARIVSRPVLLASNNREARILVGSQRPFVQVSRSLPTDTPSRDQVVQYKDVGTKLTVLPTINPDGYVALLIRQEVNSATAETQFDAPIISTREAETEVLVKDGQTIVLGGLRERQHEVARSGIPLLSELPIIGGLFGFEERRTTETELFLFITPMILADDEAVDAATDAALNQSERAGVTREERER